MSPLFLAAFAAAFRAGLLVRAATPGIGAAAPIIPAPVVASSADGTVSHEGAPPLPGAQAKPPSDVGRRKSPNLIPKDAPPMPNAPVPPGVKPGSGAGANDGTKEGAPPLSDPNTGATMPIGSKPEAAKKPTRTVGGWFDESVRRRIQVTGRRTLSLQFQNVSGDTSAYDSLTNYGQGLARFTDTGSMQVQGSKVLGFLDFQMSMNDNRFQDPQNQRYTLRYAKQGFDVAYGTIQGSLLNTNPLVSFTRSLEGASAGYSAGRMQVKYLRSEARGDARTVTLEGNNSPGPYYLQSGRIVNDSLRVLLDGKPQRLGTDFTLDADLGAITFVDRSISPTSSIVVTYEAYGLDSRRGGIQGMGASYDLGRFGRFGFSTVKQTSPGTTGTGLRKEAFQGFGDPATPYYLQFEPVPGTIQITVDGIVQVPGVAGAAGGDYAFDPQNPVVFYFRRYIPTTQTVIVSYRPKATGTVSGDRTVVGYDYRLSLKGVSAPPPRVSAKTLGAIVGFLPRGIVRAATALAAPEAQPGAYGAAGYGDGVDLGYGSYLQAYGATGSAAGGAKGTARGYIGQYDYRGFVFRGAVRDTPSSFVSIEQTGFNRNEKATDMSLTKRSGDATYQLSSTNALVYSPTYSVTGEPLVGTASRLTETSAIATFAPANGLRWTVQQRRSVAERGVTGQTLRQDSRLDTTSLTASRRAGRLGFNAGFDHQTGVGPVTLDGTSSIRDVGIDSTRFGLDYFLGHGVTVTGRTSLSRVSSGGQSGNGTDTSLSVSLAPIGAWSGVLAYARSDSGALATLGGFADSFGAGYGDSGFSSGLGTATNYGGSKVSLVSATTNYRASERLNLTGRFYDQTSQGSVTSNASTRAMGFGAMYDLRGGNLLSVSLDKSLTSFFAAGATSAESTTIDAFFAGSPKGPWSYRIGVNSLVSSGGTYAQSAFGFDASLSHRLDDRQRLTFAASVGRTRGYYPQDDNSLAVSYDYRLFGNVGLVTAYRWRALRNFDQTVATGAFRSSGLSLELSFDFSR